MKFVGVLVFVGLICAASAKLPMANRKYKFYFNRFFATLFLMVVMVLVLRRAPTSIQLNE
jgi:ABC-type Fe3+-siderophore transport system permease subunit